MYCSEKVYFRLWGIEGYGHSYGQQGTRANNTAGESGQVQQRHQESKAGESEPDA